MNVQMLDDLSSFFCCERKLAHQLIPTKLTLKIDLLRYSWSELMPQVANLVELLKTQVDCSEPSDQF
jgi:hypothetical protein